MSSNSDINKGTLITFNATENALLDFISNCSGFTAAVDESGINNYSTSKNMWYSICSGSSKMRLNGDSTQKPVKKYSSIVLKASKYSFIDNSTSGGIRVRLFKLNDNFTKSAANNDRIKKTVKSNYGYAGEALIRHLTSNLSEIDNLYKHHKNELLRIAKK